MEQSKELFELKFHIDLRRTREKNLAEMLKLRLYGDPILRKSSIPVVAFNGELSSIADGMIKIMCEEGGIGLAAPQVGFKKRMIVARRMKDAEDTSASPIILVNPVVEAVSDNTWEYEEGCLSLPGITGVIIRPDELEVKYQSLEGETLRLAAGSIFGRILLHEIDHLDGRLFIDYLSSAKKSLAKSRLKSLTKKNLF